MAKASTKARAQSRTAAKVPAANSGHRGQQRPAGKLASPTAGKHSVTTRTQPVNKTPAGKGSGSAGNW